jgi:type II secretory pathway component GspD/PulD (secretin)
MDWCFMSLRNYRLKNAQVQTGDIHTLLTHQYFRETRLRHGQPARQLDFTQLPLTSRNMPEREDSHPPKIERMPPRILTDFCFANLAGQDHDWPMIPRRTFASVLCAVLFGAFGQVAVSAADGGSGTNLETRVFRVDPDRFYAALLNIPGLQTNGVSTNAISPKSLSSVLGVDLTAPGRSVAFNDKLGLLFVKATASELDTIERIVQVLNQVSPQIHIKTRFVKMSEADADAILKAGTAVDTKEKNTVEIMTAAKATPLLQKLKSRGGMDVLGEPEVITTNGRQTQMRATDTVNVTNNFAPQDNSVNSTAAFPQVEKIETGPIMDVVPYVLSDGYTINLRVIASVSEILHYGKETTVKPVIGSLQDDATVNLWDNQTLILASNNPGTDKTRLLVFITATIVDPAGNRVHSDDDLLLMQQKIKSEIPPQHTLITTPSP